MNELIKEETDLLDKLLHIIKKEQDYSEEEMHLFKHIALCKNEEEYLDKYYVRLTTHEDVTLDFICNNVTNKPEVLETEFDAWPIVF